MFNMSVRNYMLLVEAVESTAVLLTAPVDDRAHSSCC